MTANRKRLLSDLVGPLVVFVIFIAIWYATAYGLDNNFSPASNKPLIIPPPHRLLEDLNGITRAKILTASIISIKTSLVGLLISIVIGLALGIVMAQARWLEKALWPYLIAIQVTPIIALVPLMIKIVGSNFAARVIVTVIISLFPIVSNTLFGLRSVDRNLHDLFTLHQIGRIRRMIKLQLPAASPAIFTGFRISAGLAVIGAIVGDFFFTKGEPGLGKLITYFFVNNQAGPMFISSICAALLGLSLFVVFGVINKIAVGRWHEGTTNY